MGREVGRAGSASGEDMFFTFSTAVSSNFYDRLKGIQRHDSIEEIKHLCPDCGSDQLRRNGFTTGENKNTNPRRSGATAASILSSRTRRKSASGFEQLPGASKTSCTERLNMRSQSLPSRCCGLRTWQAGVHIRFRNPPMHARDQGGGPARRRCGPEARRCHIQRTQAHPCAPAADTTTPPHPAGLVQLRCVQMHFPGQPRSLGHCGCPVSSRRAGHPVVRRPGACAPAHRRPQAGQCHGPGPAPAAPA